MNDNMSEIKPVVSVIMPCYNQEKYVREALMSVQGQTFSDFECIVINDGSTDDSLKEIQDFCKEDSRFVYYDKKNEGVSVARNYGIARSHGQYILPLDADDKIAANYLQETIAIMKDHPETKLVYTDTRYFGEMNRHYDLPAYDFELLLCRNHIVCTALYKRADFDKTGGYNPNMDKGYEDWDFWLSFLSPEDKVYQIHQDLFFYRIKRKSRNVNAKTNFSLLRRQIWQNHRELYASHFVDPAKCEEYRLLSCSMEYRLGKVLLYPIRRFLSVINSIR